MQCLVYTICISAIVLQMYFISRGEVEVLSGEDDSVLVTNMKAGDFFGEVSCFVGCLTTATVM